MKSRDIQEAPGWVSVGCGFLTPEREGFAYSGERCVGARLPAAQTEEVAQLTEVEPAPRLSGGRAPATWACDSWATVERVREPLGV